MLGFAVGVLVGAPIGVLVICMLQAGRVEAPRQDVIDNLGGGSRINRSHEAEVLRMRSMLQREGIGGLW